MPRDINPFGVDQTLNQADEIGARDFNHEIVEMIDFGGDHRGERVTAAATARALAREQFEGVEVLADHSMELAAQFGKALIAELARQADHGRLGGAHLGAELGRGEGGGGAVMARDILGQLLVFRG